MFQLMSSLKVSIQYKNRLRLWLLRRRRRENVLQGISQTDQTRVMFVSEQVLEQKGASVRQ